MPRPGPRQRRHQPRRRTLRSMQVVNVTRQPHTGWPGDAVAVVVGLGILGVGMLVVRDGTVPAARGGRVPSAQRPARCAVPRWSGRSSSSARCSSVRSSRSCALAPAALPAGDRRDRRDGPQAAHRAGGQGAGQPASVPARRSAPTCDGARRRPPRRRELRVRSRRARRRTGRCRHALPVRPLAARALGPGRSA